MTDTQKNGAEIVKSASIYAIGPGLSLIGLLIWNIYTTLDHRVSGLETVVPSLSSQISVFDAKLERGRAERDRQLIDIADSLREIRQTQLENAKIVAAAAATIAEMQRQRGNR